MDTIYEAEPPEASTSDASAPLFALPSLKDFQQHTWIIYLCMFLSLLVGGLWGIDESYGPFLPEKCKYPASSQHTVSVGSKIFWSLELGSGKKLWATLGQNRATLGAKALYVSALGRWPDCWEVFTGLLPLLETEAFAAVVRPFFSGLGVGPSLLWASWLPYSTDMISCSLSILVPTGHGQGALRANGYFVVGGGVLCCRRLEC